MPHCRILDAAGTLYCTKEKKRRGDIEVKPSFVVLKISFYRLINNLKYIFFSY